MVKHRGDDVCGVLLLDKPTGRSSNFYLQRLKFLFNAKKAGHTGSLDPLATGLLPVCFGKATCISEYFLHSEKSYEAVIQLGVTTVSHDCDSDVVDTNPVDVTDELLQAALPQFIGDIEQTPPMVSALKHKGQPLYKMALKGKEIERKPRKMKVFSLTAKLLEGDQVKLAVHCSSGFYVRQLAADLGEALGCGAHIVALRRTTSKYLTLEGAHSFDEVVERIDALDEKGDKAEKTAYIESLLVPPENLLKSLPVLTLGLVDSINVSNGRKIPLDKGLIQETDIAKVTSDEQHFRVYQDLAEQENLFLGIGVMLGDGLLKVRKRFNPAIS